MHQLYPSLIALLASLLEQQNLALSPDATFEIVALSAFLISIFRFVARVICHQENQYQSNRIVQILSHSIAGLQTVLYLDLTRRSSFATAVSTLALVEYLPWTVNSWRNSWILNILVVGGYFTQIAAIRLSHGTSSVAGALALSCLVQHALKRDQNQVGKSEPDRYLAIFESVGPIALFFALGSIKRLVDFHWTIYLNIWFMVIASAAASCLISQASPDTPLRLGTLAASITLTTSAMSRVKPSMLQWYGLALQISSSLAVWQQSVPPEQEICLEAAEKRALLDGDSSFDSRMDPAENYSHAIFRSLRLVLFTSMIATVGLVYISVDIHSLSVSNQTWTDVLRERFRVSCPADVETRTYTKGSDRTGFPSFPRSGNTYIRSLVEQASGYRTSSLYCDSVTSKIFKDDCMSNGTFFEKTHHPYMLSNPEDGWRRYAKVVRVTRNPIDALYSLWHLRKTNEAFDYVRDHTLRAEIDHILGEREDEAQDLIIGAQAWVDFDAYWSEVPIPQYSLRFEDMRRNTLSSLLSLLSFLLPRAELPSLSTVLCTLEDRKALEPYHAHKRSPFYAYDLIHPPVRQQILEITKIPFCKHGYDKLFVDVFGFQRLLPLDCERILRDLAPLY